MNQRCTVFTLATLAIFFPVFTKMVVLGAPGVVDDAEKMAREMQLMDEINKAQAQLKALESAASQSMESSSEISSQSSESASSQSKESSEESSSSSASSERVLFAYSKISTDAYEDYQDLIRGGRSLLSKGELRARLLKWAKDNGVQEQYETDMATFNSVRTFLSETLVRNLAGEALEAYKQLLAIENDDSLTQKEECQAFSAVYTSIKPEIRALVSLDPMYTSMKECMKPRYDIALPAGYQSSNEDSSLIVSVSIDCSMQSGGGSGCPHQQPPTMSMMMDDDASFETDGCSGGGGCGCGNSGGCGAEEDPFQMPPSMMPMLEMPQSSGCSGGHGGCAGGPMSF